MLNTPLACTVRGCGEPLTRGARAWTCRRGHGFDIARTGYVNLLQPQDRRSTAAGDPRAAVDARARLIAQGVGSVLSDAVIAAVAARLRPDSVVVELGCGTGDLLETLQRRTGTTAIGIDLSPHAIDRAARRTATVQWVVANADRRLPIVDRSADIALSINARRNPQDVARVLAPEGRLLVAIPADDDLRELRQAVQGEAVARDRVESVIAEHAERFTVIDRWSVRESRDCSNATIRDVLASTYRSGRRSQEERITAIERMAVTFASEAVLFSVK